MKPLIAPEEGVAVHENVTGLTFAESTTGELMVPEQISCDMERLFTVGLGFTCTWQVDVVPGQPATDGEIV